MIAGYVATTLVVLALLVWWLAVQWSECRASGLSVLYCIQHIA